MYKLIKLKKDIKYYFYDHPIKKNIAENFYMLLITALSGLVFAFGFNTFIQPNYQAMAPEVLNEVTIKYLASCGASGISQSLNVILKLCRLERITNEINFNISYWLFYLLVNIPLFFLGFFRVGKKFAIYSLINVCFASLFGILLKSEDPYFFINQISSRLATETVARVLFAGMCTGLASALAYKIDSTAGGTDIIAFFISEKKSVLIGKWSTFFNVIIVSTYSILSCIDLDQNLFPDGSEFASIEPSIAFITFLFTLLYMIVVAFVVDIINTKNKKYNVEIFTPNLNLSQSIIAAVPHGCTIIDGRGGYSGKPVYMIQISVRKSEVKQIVKLTKAIDPSAFINVWPMEQVYGKFYRNPIK